MLAEKKVRVQRRWRQEAEDGPTAGIRLALGVGEERLPGPHPTRMTAIVQIGDLGLVLRHEIVVERSVVELHHRSENDRTRLRFDCERLLHIAARCRRAGRCVVVTLLEIDDVGAGRQRPEYSDRLLLYVRNEAIAGEWSHSWCLHGIDRDRRAPHRDAARVGPTRRDKWGARCPDFNQVGGTRMPGRPRQTEHFATR